MTTRRDPRRKADWWGHNVKAGTCCCCQHAGPVYKGYTGGQFVGVECCAECKSSSHPLCGDTTQP